MSPPGINTEVRTPIRLKACFVALAFDHSVLGPQMLRFIPADATMSETAPSDSTSTMPRCASSRVFVPNTARSLANSLNSDAVRNIVG